MEHQYSCSPLSHITVDGGQRYLQYESFFMPNGTIDMRISAFESDPKRLQRLGRIWAAYRKTLDDDLMSASHANGAEHENGQSAPNQF